MQMPGTGAAPSEVTSTLISSWLNKLALSTCYMYGLRWGLGFGGLNQESGFAAPWEETVQRA